ncbi:MAG: hypothetical protein A2W91_07195 [Bacteroidetes bacterium GWF2_38_335]|nr:MAG: hypothetical protein A2W91_07195 [Bacteroidetes bacterium GWF2_38_335]OFY77113.1 MAG: hypothetical protein A2281_14430 [Bacteroidetes bacterium RIFOXYA12_FULL_38_20]HBS85004.1 hypothetical protein [Bacteroidales bacterium]
MINNKKTEKQLHEIELSLNQFYYKGIKIGSILSFYFDRIYCHDFDNRLLRQISSLGYYFIKSIGKSKYLINYEKNIIYFNRGTSRHYLEMVKAVTNNEEIRKKTLIIGPPGASDIEMRKVFYFSNLKDFFQITFFIIAKKRKISKILKPLQFKNKLVLYIILLSQLLKANSIQKFIKKQSPINLIGSDADRCNNASLFFAVAKNNKISTFTLQHGVINARHGYFPLIADEAWVWGQMAHKQFVEMGEIEEKIKITGTPIVQNLLISQELKHATKIKYNYKLGKTIVLALSEPNFVNDQKMIRFFCEIKEKYGSSNDNFLVKIHPARKFSNYAWIQNEFDIQLISPDIPYEEFMNLVDILLAHTSGLATEALYYQKKVGIINILPDSAGNGLELNKYLNVPLIHNITEFELLLKDDNQIDSGFVFYKIGESAKIKISNCIEEKITSK